MKGIVKLLSGQIEALLFAGQQATAMKLLLTQREILTNGYRAPIPAKTPNQRQRRKQARQCSK